MNVLASTADLHGQAFLLAPLDAGRASAGDLPLTFFRRSKEQLRLRLYVTLLVIDLVCIAMGFVAAGALRLGAPFGEQMARTLAVVLPTFLAIALNNGAYSLASLQSPSRGATKAVVALLYAIALAIALLFSLKVSSTFSRIVFSAALPRAVMVEE